MSDLKILAFDIETTNLRADFGSVIAIGWSWSPFGRIRVANTPSKCIGHDKTIVSDFAKQVENADLIVTWYGKRFDVPFLNTRLMFWGCHPLPPVRHWDGWEAAKRHLLLSSNRLANVADAFGFTPKRNVSGSVWRMAGQGDERAMKLVVKRCKGDVATLIESYYKLRSLHQPHPNQRIVGNSVCPVCDREGYLALRGRQITLAGVQQRYQCSHCGRWSHGPTKMAGKTQREVR